MENGYDMFALKLSGASIAVNDLCTSHSGAAVVQPKKEKRAGLLHELRHDVVGQRVVILYMVSNSMWVNGAYVLRV